ncbi:hypothetical protein GQ457_04G021280 [Hibiscus cannabinus]
MFRSMMSHNDIPTSFWGHALETVAFTLNCVSSKLVQKTPHEMWTRKRPNMSFKKVWGCEAYVKHQMSNKLEPKSQNVLLFDIPKKLRDTISTIPKRTKCLLLERETFLKKNFSRTNGMVEILNLKKFKNNKSMNQKLKKLLKVVEENSPDLETQPLRRSTREHHDPERYGFLVTTHGDIILVDQDEPKTYQEAVASPDSEKWFEVMRSEMDSMSENQVWTLVEPPEGVKPIGCKWVFKKKTDMDGNVQTYKGRLVAKAAFHDYEIWQMDVKTAFLNGKLEDDVYMTQPECFVTPEKAGKLHDPNIFALMETWISGEKADEVIRRHGSANSFRVEATRFPRGIWLLWKDNTRVDVLFVSDGWDSGGDFNAIVTVSERMGVQLEGMVYVIDLENSFVQHLPRLGSDHRPILFNTVVRQPRQNNVPFNYLAAWQSDDRLEVMNKETFGHIEKQKHRLLNRIMVVEKALESSSRQQLIDLELKLKRELSSFLDHEEALWFQRAWTQWINDRDRNTKLYHQTTKVKNRSKQFSMIRLDGGQWSNDADNIRKGVVRFFEHLFTGNGNAILSNCPRGRFENLSVTELDRLSSSILAEEVRVAIFDMGPLKVLRDDGINAMFYQRNWVVFGQSVIQFVRDCFPGDPVPSEINKTIFVLIPRWNEIRLSRHGPGVSRLFFADDLAIFAKAIVNQMEIIRDLLQQFCDALGHKVIATKTKIMFSKNTSSRIRSDIVGDFGYTEVQDLVRYLGVLLLHRHVKKATYDYIIEKVRSRFTGWSARSLSMVGRITLLKSVIQAIPTYSMQSTWLPISVCLEVEKLIRGFLWGHSVNHKGTNLINWDAMKEPLDKVRVLRAKHKWVGIVPHTLASGSCSRVWAAIHTCFAGGICAATPHPHLGADRIVWKETTNCTFTIKSSYRKINGVSSSVRNSCWRAVWDMEVPQRIHVFLWLAMHGNILTNAERQRRHLATDDMCSIHSSGYEDISHILRDCSMARMVWQHVTIVLLLCQRLPQGISDVVVCVYFAYLHISLIYDLTAEMEVPKNVFGSLMRSGFLCLCNGSIVVKIEIYNIRYARNNP